MVLYKCVSKQFSIAGKIVETQKITEPKSENSFLVIINLYEDY